MSDKEKKLSFDLSFLDKGLKGISSKNTINEIGQDSKVINSKKSNPVKTILLVVGVIIVYSSLNSIIPMVFQGSKKDKQSVYEHREHERSNELANSLKRDLEAGILLFKEQKFEQALSNFNKAIKIIEDSPSLNNESQQVKDGIKNVYFARAILHNSLKNYSLAINDFDQSISFGYTKGLYYFRGKTFFDSKQYKLAIDDFNNSILKNEHLNESRYYRGSSYMVVNQFQKAVDDFNSTIKNNFEFGLSSCLKGIALSRLNFHKESKIALQEAAIFFSANGKTQDYQDLVSILSSLDEQTGYKYSYSNIL